MRLVTSYFLVALLLVLDVACCAPVQAAESAKSNAPKNYALNYLGKVRLSVDKATDQNGATFTITGLSGIAYGFDNRYVAVMDNSNHLVFLNVTFKDDGTIDQASVTGGHTIATSRDYEGIAYTGQSRNSVFLSNEATPPPPALYEYSLDKSATPLQTVGMPPVFMYQVDNRGLESLTRRADGQEIWTANEEALTADGVPSTRSAGSVVRLVRFAVNSNTLTPAQEYAYVLEPIHAGVGTPFSSGLSDLVVLPDGTLLTLERSAIEGLPTFETRIFQVDFNGATDISQGVLANGLKGQNYKPVGKKLLFASTQIGENLEGLCFGPALPNGNQVLLGVVDNGDPVSKNTLVSFVLVDPAPLPPEIIYAAAGGVLLLVILIWVVSRRWRKNTADA
ncbi:MAG TPA: esterase-like activity of phytase family protein [Pirellulales bacterium]|jgi:3-phytase/alkaline phosphatase D|nr:esterase-like activity of phytase family protein [Pirellulales bacterium]